MRKGLLKTYCSLVICLTTLMSCENSDETIENNNQQVSLFNKTWVASNGTTSLRIRMNSDGTYLQGDDGGFPEEGSWTWENEEEQIVRTVYQDETVWYKFENLTTISVTGFISDTKPFNFGNPISFSLSNR